MPIFSRNEATVSWSVGRLLASLFKSFRLLGVDTTLFFFITMLILLASLLEKNHFGSGTIIFQESMGRLVFLKSEFVFFFSSDSVICLSNLA